MRLRRLSKVIVKLTPTLRSRGIDLLRNSSKVARDLKYVLIVTVRNSPLRKRD